MTEEETIFVCVNLLTDEVVNLAEVDRSNQPEAKSVRQSQSGGEADDYVCEGHTPK
jgi:hypothetical protein